MIASPPAEPSLMARNQLDLLFDLTTTTDRESKQLINFFVNNQAVLTDVMPMIFGDMVSRMCAGWMRDGLIDPRFDKEFWNDFANGNPGLESFRTVFKTFLDRIQVITGKLRGAGDFYATAFNAPIVVMAYTATRWLKIAFQSRPDLTKLADKDFHTSVWDALIQPLDTVTITLAVAEGDEIKFPHHDEMAALRFDDFADLNKIQFGNFPDDMEKFVRADKKVDNLNFKISPGVDKPQKLRNFFTLAVARVNQTFPAVQTKSPFEFLGQILDPKNRFNLVNDSTNLMDFMNSMIGQSPRSLFRTAEEIMIVDSGLSSFSPKIITDIVDQLPDENNLRPSFRKLFYAAPMLREFDRPGNRRPGRL
jgi:hypothetical protein